MQRGGKKGARALSMGVSAPFRLGFQSTRSRLGQLEGHAPSKKEKKRKERKKTTPRHVPARYHIRLTAYITKGTMMRAFGQATTSVLCSPPPGPLRFAPGPHEARLASARSSRASFATGVCGDGSMDGKGSGCTPVVRWMSVPVVHITWSVR